MAAYTYDAGGNILTAMENGITHTYTYGNTVRRCWTIFSPMVAV